jgi:hypothetical protein
VRRENNNKIRASTIESDERKVSLNEWKLNLKHQLLSDQKCLTAIHSVVDTTHYELLTKRLLFNNELMKN